ncbi:MULTISPECIES: hypothetical protein [unclassified Aureispira]|uniref:hypothetical protein n=1 Tax=unclassified Aureispira TaxID=2649989 RepID=UPI0012DE6132|nr:MULTISPECIES: hypothetical protein [unclassified Aureispira]WMX14055.1 hypothetical protein QP953_24690 [Aureispira sp. CCB-E]
MNKILLLMLGALLLSACVEEPCIPASENIEGEWICNLGPDYTLEFKNGKLSDPGNLLSYYKDTEGEYKYKEYTIDYDSLYIFSRLTPTNSFFYRNSYAITMDECDYLTLELSTIINGQPHTNAIPTQLVRVRE